MTDEFVENDDWESILRTERKIALDVNGPTPNEVDHGLGLDHPALDPEGETPLSRQAVDGKGDAGSGHSVATRSPAKA